MNIRTRILSGVLGAAILMLLFLDGIRLERDFFLGLAASLLLAFFLFRLRRSGRRKNFDVH